MELFFALQTPIYVAEFIIQCVNDKIYYSMC